MRYSRSVHRTVPLYLCALSLMASSAAVQACSKAPEASGDTTLVVGVDGSQVTLENQTGTSLVKGEISVMPQGLPRPYVMLMPFMPTGAKRVFNLTQFRQFDGTPWRSGIAKGKTVKVSAVDSTGKNYMREIPFE